MAIDFARQVYLPSYNVLARPVTFTPLASRPGEPAFTGRGIYATEPMDVLAEDGSVFSDQRTILDVLEYEFVAIPIQGDRLNIPAYMTLPALGDFEVSETKTNGGGETTLSLRKIMETKP